MSIWLTLVFGTEQWISAKRTFLHPEFDLNLTNSSFANDLSFKFTIFYYFHQRINKFYNQLKFTYLEAFYRYCTC